MLKEVYCVKCNSPCKPPQGRSNMVACTNCGYLFEVMRGSLQKQENEPGELPQQQMPPTKSLQHEVVRETDSRPKPLPQSFQQAVDSEPGIQPEIPIADDMSQWPEPEEENAKQAMSPITRKLTKEENKEEEAAEKKKRFALTKPDNLVYHTYAAPLKNILEMQEKVLGKPNQQEQASAASSSNKKPNQADASPAHKQHNQATTSPSRKPDELKPPFAKPETRKILSQLVTKEKSPLLAIPQNTPLSMTAKLKLRFKRKRPKLTPTQLPQTIVPDGDSGKTGSRIRQPLLLIVFFISLGFIYVLSMPPVLYYFPNPPDWVTQCYYPVSTLEKECPWIKEIPLFKEYRQWWRHAKK